MRCLKHKHSNAFHHTQLAFKSLLLGFATSKVQEETIEGWAESLLWVCPGVSPKPTARPWWRLASNGKKASWAKGGAERDMGWPGKVRIEKFLSTWLVRQTVLPPLGQGHRLPTRPLLWQEPYSLEICRSVVSFFPSPVPKPVP